MLFCCCAHYPHRTRCYITDAKSAWLARAFASRRRTHLFSRHRLYLNVTCHTGGVRNTARHLVSNIVVILLTWRLPPALLIPHTTRPLSLSYLSCGALVVDTAPTTFNLPCLVIRVVSTGRRKAVTRRARSGLLPWRTA